MLLLTSILNGQVIFEAEDAFVSNGEVATGHIGYTGDGFVDTENEVGVYVEWTVNSLKSVNDSIGFRYALGKDEIRQMQIYVNDVLLDTIDFDRSGEFTDYAYKYITGQINIGENKIKAVSINAEGAPNLDHITVKTDTNLYFKISTSVSGNGDLDISPVADSFKYGARVKIIPMPEPGYAFNEWGGDLESYQDPLVISNIYSDYSLIANFINVLPAFPGAEGFATNITGGRGGSVVEVTNLYDSGLGSFRAALNLTGRRTIVFRVSGNIVLNSKLSINNGDVTIAGQTAPGQGITLSGYPLTVNADNVIIRYIRCRLGDAKLVVDDAANGRNHENIIIDHCSFSWSVDETASFYDNKNFTMQYCLISESLYNSIHEKTKHGYGGIWGGKGATFHHNLIAHHTSRNPRFCGARYSNLPDQELVDYRNNVIYNWGFNSVYGAEGGNYNLINNYYKSGPATSSSVRTRIIAPNASSDPDNPLPLGVWGMFYVNGNYIYGYPSVTENNWVGVNANISDKTQIMSTEEFVVDSVTTQSAEIAYENVLAQVGACLPYRDEVDTRVISETMSGTATYGGVYGEGKGIIDSQTDVGGWPGLTSTTPPTDTDKDGMPDGWETVRGLNLNDAEDRNGDDDGDGYTNLEEYLNELADYTYVIRPLNFTLESSSEKEVVLSWDDEIDGESGYLLERKSVGDYEQIAVVPANTTTYKDVLTSVANYTYRLRSYSTTDTSYYSDTIFVKLATSVQNTNFTESQISVYPNPFNTKFVVELNTEKTDNVAISLLDISGKIVVNSNVYPLIKGTNSLEIDAENLKPGIYNLLINTSGYCIHKKVIKR